MGLSVRIRAVTLVTSVGNGLTGAALVFYLVHRLPAHLVAYPLFFLALGLSLAVVFLSPLTDRFSRPQVAGLSDLVRMVATAALAVTDWFPLVCLAFFLNGLMSTVNRPAVTAVWSDLATDAEHRRKLFATNAALNRTGLALGGALGGLVVMGQHWPLGFWLDAATFALSGGFWLWLHRAHPELRGPQTSTTEVTLSPLRLDKSLRTSWAVIAPIPWLAVYVLSQVVMALPLQVLSVSTPVVIATTLSPTMQGLWAALPSWLLLAGNILGRLLPRIPAPGLLLALSGALMAGASGAVVLPQLVWVAIAAMAAGRILNAVAMPALNAWVGTAIDPKDQGKAFALSTDASTILGPVGILLAAPLVATFDPTTVTLTAAALATAMALSPLMVGGFIEFKDHT